MRMRQQQIDEAASCTTAVSTMSRTCHRGTPTTSTIHRPPTAAQDAGLPSPPSTSNRSQPLEDRSIPFGHQPTLTFRVTGAASVARLEPLLLDQDEGDPSQAKWTRAVDDHGDDEKSPTGGRIDFVWETTVMKHQVQRHRKSRVLNRLSGAQVLEDKANLVLLQRLMAAPTLESYAVSGRNEVARWAHARFQPQRKESSDRNPRCERTAGRPDGVATLREERSLTKDSRAADDTLAEKDAAATVVGDGGAGGEDWWCVKAAGGNGGLDIWVLHEGNWKHVTDALSDEESYVIQRYVARPMLWRGRKFHFRAYALVRADMSAWLYQTAFILSASRPYSLAAVCANSDDGGGAEFADDLVHISNLAVNKHTDGHPGQVPCDLPREYAAVWPKMLELVRSLVHAATPFMQHQANPNNFEFLGLDVIADSSGGVWLMEVNRLPGLQSSKQNLEEENIVYDGMMLDLIRLLVLPPLTGCPPDQGLFAAAAGPAPSARAPSTETWRNVMRFAAFKRSSCRAKTPSS
ncbi:unnamed protein product [Scytosiphon promiscuus]